jgi:hypothetical protein
MSLIPLANDENGEIKSFDFESVGGAIGAVNEENFVRISNSTLRTTLETNYQSDSFGTNDYFDLYAVGGVIGEVRYDEGDDYPAVIQLLGNSANLDISLSMSQLTPHLTLEEIPSPSTSTQLNFYFEGIGGAIGAINIDNLVIVDVAGSYDLDFSFSLQNNDFSNKYVSIDIQSMGGYIGYTADKTTLLTSSMSVEFNFDYNVSNNFLSSDNQQEPEPYPSDFVSRIYYINAFAGYFNGIAFMTDYTGTSNIDILDQTVVTGMNIISQSIIQVGSFTGNNQGIIIFN